MQSRLDTIEHSTNNIDRRMSNFERFIDRRVSEQITDLEVALTQLIINHTESALNVFREDNSRAIDELSSQLARHRRYVENSKLTTSPQIVSVINNELPDAIGPQVISDAMYMALEDAFRGSHARIQKRLSQYLHLFSSFKTSGLPILDIGCGRGEWLGLLKGEGFKSYGIDTNSAAIHECREAGLDVRNTDLLNHLRTLPDGSICGITMFQVLEHLPFHVLIETLQQIRRVLIPGGLFVGEVPNSENLSVAASTFWIDPTHQKPLHPQLLKFLVTESGFAKTDGIYSTRIKELPDFGVLPKEIADSLLSIFNTLFGDADFAVIAWA